MQCSSTLATSCEGLTHWKRPWCWEGLGAGGEGGNRGWDDWMAITDSMDVSLSELRKSVMDREAWRAVVHGVTESRTRLSDWTELNWYKGILLTHKKNEIMPFVATWMGLEIIRSKGSQRKTNRRYFLYMESRKRVQMNLLTKQKQSQMSKTNLWLPEER